jgi:hypothetical protein
MFEWDKPDKFRKASETTDMAFPYLSVSRSYRPRRGKVAGARQTEGAVRGHLCFVSASSDAPRPLAGNDLQPNWTAFTDNWGSGASVATWNVWHGCDG